MRRFSDNQFCSTDPLKVYINGYHQYDNLGDNSAMDQGPIHEENMNISRCFMRSKTGQASVDRLSLARTLLHSFWLH